MVDRIIPLIKTAQKSELQRSFHRVSCRIMSGTSLATSIILSRPRRCLSPLSDPMTALFLQFKLALFKYSGHFLLTAIVCLFAILIIVLESLRSIFGKLKNWLCGSRGLTTVLASPGPPTYLLPLVCPPTPVRKNAAAHTRPPL